ncbi:putative helicase [Trypanosoma conorhini]|uniref:Putative helicase n=1 Tax=Trypanosoma conorhini TaxID=83891 RepID=A0A422PXL4_9TRYP|nr:putative helicase [Trypanosoma conorhini]RNF22456.1 putative helicase [Trypanosoma conorhini]
MCTIPVGDVEVPFPFNPYPAQVEYMRAVIDALNGRANALLESPTGTGKTLSLLCSVLAWLEKRQARQQRGPESEGADMPRVIYCSRTHAQLSQVIRELKRTRYAGAVAMAVLGSREHMCVNPQVLRLPTAQAQQGTCNTLREEKNCRFYRGFQARSSHNAVMQDEKWIHDMEDLVSDGRKCGYCPYYSEREQAKEAELVFLPYNYLFDVSIRKQLPFEVKGSILIVDEAHNLPSVLASSSCMNLQPIELTNAIHDCSRAIAMQRLLRESAAADDDSQDGLMEEQEFASLKIILCRLESCILEERGGDKKTTEEVTSRAEDIGASTVTEIVQEGSYMFPFLAKALITRDLFLGGANHRQGGGMNDVMTKAIAALAQSESAASGLSKVQQFLTFVFERDGDGDDDEACRFVLQGTKSTDRGSNQRSLGYWCLDTSHAVQTLVTGLRSLLLTSGTLSPLEHFAAELGVPFGVALKGAHVIQRNQVLGCVLCKGPSGEKLNGGYAYRNSVDYRVGLGMSLVNIARNTPGGVLVFFPSYVALNAAVELWRAGSGRVGDTVTVWGMLEELKPVFVEPVEAANLQTIVSSFQREVDSAPSRGAVLLAVCRGKISEGIDFADNHGRCVVVAGIPFANHTELFVRLKRAYLTRVASHRPKVRGKLFTGDDWYVNEAMRAVNQCVGRVIRHKDDYGVVLLADERFAERLGGLSEWVADRCTVHREFREAYAAVAQFFASFRRRSGDVARPSASPFSAADKASDVQADAQRVSAREEHVPDSAEMASRFASEQLRRTRAEENEQVRRRIADAREMPATPCRVSATNAMTSNEGGGGERGGAAAKATPAAATVPTAARPLFRKQVLPALPTADTAEASTALVGTTSKEFCQFLKRQLQPASYDKFRDYLRQIATTRNTSTLSSDEMKRALSGAVEGVAALFKEAAGERDAELLNAFGQHIPAEFRPYYMHLLRKRRRTSE